MEALRLILAMVAFGVASWAFLHFVDWSVKEERGA